MVWKLELVVYEDVGVDDLCSSVVDCVLIEGFYCWEWVWRV